MSWLWSSYWSLPWWANILICCYTIYFLVRSCYIWKETKDGLWSGLKTVFFDDEKHIRLYHLIIIIIDIPPAIVGLFFPIIRTILVFKIYTFKPKEVKKED